VRSPEGKILRVLEFSPGAAVELKAEDVSAVLNDIGKALLPVVFDAEKGKYVVIDLTAIDVAASATEVASVTEVVEVKKAETPSQGKKNASNVSK